MTENEVVQLVTEKKPLRKPVEETRFGEKDDFDREIIADNIIKLLDSDLTDCYPMAIDGGWGTGKSEFCHKLINKLRDNAANYKPRNVIYFDAFEAENVEEPLLSLLAKITKVVPETEKKAFISKIVPVVKYGLGVTLKGLANHLARQNGDTLSEGFQDAFADGAKSGIDRLLKEYSQAKSHLKTLKDCIEQAAKTKELVIFVDELDRCRPDFALNVFELVKHVFDILGVKFIFVVNSEQIKSMIKNRYGEDVDTQTYMEKFVHYFVTLPHKSMVNDCEISNSIKMIFNFGKENNIKAISGEDTYFNMIIENIFVKNKVSLRKVIEIIKNTQVYRVLNKNNNIDNNKYVIYMYIEIISIFLFSIDKNLSTGVMSKSFSWSSITSFIGGSRDSNYNAIHAFLNDCMQKGDTFALNLSFNHPYYDEYRQFFYKFFPETRADGTTVFYNTIKTLNFCG